MRSFINAVSVVVVRELEGARETLLVRRAKEPLRDRWLYVTGGIEAGECAAAAAVRELDEETGLRAERLFSTGVVEIFHAVDGDELFLFPVFLALVSGDAEVVLNPEASAFRWLDFAAALQAVSAANHRRVLRGIERDVLAYPLDPWYALDPGTGLTERSE